MLLRSFTTASTAASMPRLSPIGFAPAVTFLRPSRKIAWASTVAVVVPSPATSEVLEATSLIIWAPRFLLGSFSAISFATVTPSLVMVGLPNFLAMTTFRPFGPSVTLTACDMMLTPRNSAARASSLSRSCLGMEISLPSVHEWSRAAEPLVSRVEDSEEVVLLHDQVLLAVQPDLVAGILAEEDSVALLHRERELLAIVGHLAGAHGDDRALLRLFLGGVGDDEAAALLILLVEALDEHAVMERAQRRLHCVSHRCLSHRGCLPRPSGVSTAGSSSSLSVPLK